jgi:hypothetical protein
MQGKRALLYFFSPSLPHRPLDQRSTDANVLSLSLAGLVGRDQSIVGKPTCVKAKRGLGLGPPITCIAFDGTPDDSDDKQATIPR